MKLSRDKVLRLSHLILHALNNDDGVEFFADVQQIRGRDPAPHRRRDADRRGHRRPGAAEDRDPKRPIIEGSDEWEVMYRKYYEDEVSRHRKVMP